MKTVTSTATAKAAAIATGLAMATSMLALAPFAHAASYTFSKDLTMGSKGADVTALQQELIARGFSIPAGATGYFGGQTRTAVIAWQKSAKVTPAAGYFGAKSRAAFGGASSGTTTPVTGNGLKVSLAATSPNGTALVQGQGIANLAEFTFANPTATPINVTGMSFTRTGVSNDATLVNVYLYNAGTRLTDSAGVSTSAFTFSDPAALFTVPANGTYTVTVRSDIADSTAGQQIGVSLTSVTSTGTLDSSVSFPIMGGYQSVSAASLATVNFSANPTPSSATTISPSNDYPVWQDSVSVSQNAVKVSSLKFTNLGSVDSAYVTNLRLFVDGVQVGAAVPAMNSNRSVTFDLSATPFLLSTQNHIVKVLANIGAGGASRTIQFSVQRSSDVMFIDNQLGQPVTPKYNNGTFAAATTGVITLNSASVSGVSVSRNPSSPSQNIPAGASSIKMASFDILASGENVKVSDLYVYSTTTGAAGLNNGKIMVNGVQVGSTKDIGNGSGNQTDFALGSSLVLPAGIVTTVDVYADVQTAAGANITTGTVAVALAANSSNAQGTASLSTTGVPTSDVAGNTITVAASSLTATKSTGYGNQSVVAGALNAKIGSFVLSAGSTEGVNVNTINVTMSAANAASTTNLTLKDGSTILGSVVTTPSSSNSFSVNVAVAASQTKTIDIYANILSGANAGTIVASVGTGTSGSGALTNVSTSVAGAVALQTITIGSGTLSATRGAGDPVSSNVLAGASSVAVGQFNFAASVSSYTVDNVQVLVPTAAAGSVTNVTVSYKDAAGAVKSATQAITVKDGSYYKASFTGLGMFVPANDSANLDVTVGTPTVASGATSGAAINVSLDSAGFQATNAAGTISTNDIASAVASSGTFYVRKSIPTFAMLPTGVSVPSTGAPIYKFSITADPAGAVEWTKLAFNLATTSATVTNVYLTDDASGTNLTDGTAVTLTGTKASIDLANTSAQPHYQQVAAGATKTYDLYGTVAGFSTGSTVTISLASDASPVANAAAASVTGTPNTVWSDRSATSHTTSTADWTNGYLLKNFTSNAVSYSK